MMYVDHSLFRFLRVTKTDHKRYGKLFRYYGYPDRGEGDCDVVFLLYGNEIFYSYMQTPHHREDNHDSDGTHIFMQEVFREYPIETIWDIAFGLEMVGHADESGWSSSKDLQSMLAQKAVQDPTYLPFVRESHGLILWRYQAQNIPGLFFESRQVIDHYIRELGAKRMPTRERLNQIAIPSGEGLADFLSKHSFHNGIFGTPNLVAADRLWRIVNGIPHVSCDLDKIMQTGKVI